MENTQTLLSVQNIEKSFGLNRVLKGINLKLSAGEVLSLIGGNGAGKSTLMKIIMGIYQPDAGQIRIKDQEVNLNKPSVALAHGIYMVPQEPMLFPNMTVEENIVMGFDEKQAELHKRLLEVIAEVGWELDLNRKAGSLSIAEQQLVEILRGLLRNAEILILDEPTSALTFDEVQSLFKCVNDLRAKGIGIVYITHRLTEVFEISTSVAIMRDGVITLSGEVGEFTKEALVKGLLPPNREEKADSGYLTRRMVDVSQEVIIREEDCHVTHGIKVSEISENGQVIEKLSDRLRGRFLVGDVVDAETGEVLLSSGKMMDGSEDKLLESRKWVQENVRPGDRCEFDPAGDPDKKPTVMIRTVLTCKAPSGVCAKCYGMNLATSKPVGPGEAVGIIAAQSIGEPGTQLTMRTFHTGGLAGGDITQGLPRVEELFEARKPKRMATLAEIGGTVKFEEATKGSLLNIIVTAPDGDTRTYAVPHTGLLVRDGDVIEAGRQLTYGALNPHDVLRIRGADAVYNYLIQEVLRVYRQQGVDINDKHIEVIVRQMMRKVRLEDAGDTNLLDGSMVDVLELENANEDIQNRNARGETQENGEPLRPASGTQLLMGITKASLATDSFLSAASFQETTKVLTEAAIKGKSDRLAGLKENVIIGKLIPAGTGLTAYHNAAEQLIPETEEVLPEEPAPEPVILGNAVSQAAETAAISMD